MNLYATIACYADQAANLINAGLSIEAEPILREALALEPDSPLCLSHMAMALTDQGRLDEATEFLRHRLNVLSRADCPRSEAIAHMELAGLLLATGSYEAG